MVLGGDTNDASYKTFLILFTKRSFRILVTGVIGVTPNPRKEGNDAGRQISRTGKHDCKLSLSYLAPANRKAGSPQSMGSIKDRYWPPRQVESDRSIWRVVDDHAHGPTKSGKSITIPLIEYGGLCP